MTSWIFKTMKRVWVLTRPPAPCPPCQYSCPKELETHYILWCDVTPWRHMTFEVTAWLDIIAWYQTRHTSTNVITERKNTGQIGSMSMNMNLRISCFSTCRHQWIGFRPKGGPMSVRITEVMFYVEISLIYQLIRHLDYQLTSSLDGRFFPH